ncbi:MAG: hypothetical protein K1Y36_23480 [Blastocatellia bacterium]|nr:hypothetical protein [Blastocatellia bacterium]
MLHNLHLVYFDTVRLGHHLAELPLAGELGPRLWNQSERSRHDRANRGRERLAVTLPDLQNHLKMLRQELLELEVDVQQEISRIHPEDISAGLERQLFALQKELFQLDYLVDQIEETLQLLARSAEPQVQEAFRRNNAGLHDWLLSLEAIIGPPHETVC